MGDFEDITSTSEDVINNLVAEGLDPSYSGMPVLKSAAPASTGFFDSIFSALTAKPVVNAALNKYIFGSTSPIPTATNIPQPVSGQMIAGIPNSYLLIGGAAVVMLAMSKKRR
jgi:hypothetical protein